jgi:hypothetical protein
MNYNQKIREGIESAAKRYLPTSRKKPNKENQAFAGLMPKDKELPWDFNPATPPTKEKEKEGRR